MPDDHQISVPQPTRNHGRRRKPGHKQPFLRNGYRLTSGQEELYAFTMRMATGEAGQEEARQWFSGRNGDTPGSVPN